MFLRKSHCQSRCGSALQAGLFLALAIGLIGPWAGEAQAETVESTETVESAVAQSKFKNKKKKTRRAPNKKRRVVKVRGKRRSRGGMYLRYGLGFGGCLDESKLACPGNSQVSDAGGVDTDYGPGFFDFEVGYRPGVVAFELQIAQNQYDIIASENREVGANMIFGGLGVKMFPLAKGELDPYVGVRIGGMSVTQDNATDALDEGFMFSVLGGVDYLFSRHFGMGAAWGSHWLQGQEDTHSFWTARLSAIVYFDVSGSSRSRKKGKKTRTKRTPRKKRDRY